MVVIYVLNNIKFKIKVMKKTALMLIVVKLAFILLFALFLSSCRTTGYGCKGRSSWDSMIKKANSSGPYYRR
jgi:hypothetical protein